MTLIAGPDRRDRRPAAGHGAGDRQRHHAGEGPASPAIVAGFLISALGGSRVQIGGPTGAFIPVVFVVISSSATTG